MFIRRPSDIGALVRFTRRARNLNQQDLAERLGVSRWWVVEFERGKTTARLDLVLRALNELQIVLTALPNDKPPEDPATPAAPRGLLDIDDIADTGLTPSRHRGPAKTRSRR